MRRTILIRVTALLLVLTALEFVYTHTFYPKDLESKSKELLQLRNSQEQTDIYYFGESSNNTYHEKDSALNSISEFTSLFYPDLKLTNVNKNATHAGIYRGWVKHFDVHKRLPSALVITLNLRSFNAQWVNSNLETQLRESLVFGYPFPNLVNRFLLSLQAFDNKTEEQREEDMKKQWQTTRLRFPFESKYHTVSEWDQAMANGTYLKPDGTWDIKKIELACHYIKAYAFNLSHRNPRVRDFDEIARWCQRYRVPLYLNLMAENVQYADSLVGKELVFLMRQNRDFLVQRYHKNNCKVVDNLELVKGIDFIDQDWTTEHYKDKARMRVAKNLADSMKVQFNKNYKAAY